MSTPLGTRTEWLHPGGPPEKDKDPQGRTFAKTVHWDGPKLVSTFRSDEISDVVTTRWIEEEDYLVQETAFEEARFMRRFKRIDDEPEPDGRAALL